MFPVFSWYADYVDEVSKPWVIPDPDPREVTLANTPFIMRTLITAK